MSLVSSLSILTCHVILLSCILCLPFFLLFLLHFYSHVVFFTLAFLVFPVASSLSRFCLSYLLIHCSFPFNLYRPPLSCSFPCPLLPFLFSFFSYFFCYSSFPSIIFSFPACMYYILLSVPSSLSFPSILTFSLSALHLLFPYFSLSLVCIVCLPFPSSLYTSPSYLSLISFLPLSSPHSFPLVLSPSHSLSLD